MSTTLDVTMTNDDRAFITVSSSLGQRVTFDVRWRKVRIDRGGGPWGLKKYDDRYVVGIKGSDGDGFSAHKTFDLAFAAALSRARRYERGLCRLERRRLSQEVLVS